MVVFENGEPAKKEYRHFRIKTVEGPNDFASLAEVIGRRFATASRKRRSGRKRGCPWRRGALASCRI